MKPHISRQSGASLIEVLVAVLILSFGLLALGSMLAYAVQMPKLSAYRAAAASLAAGHIERMRANKDGFAGDGYKVTMTFNTALASVVACTYPNCNALNIASLDNDETGRAIRQDLPLGGMRVICKSDCANQEGEMWVIWQEPSTSMAFNSANSDECPDPAVAPTFTAFPSPQPRCLHVMFKL
jgi:type IV pilus assembly protein PilV